MMAVDDDALEPMLADCAIELGDSGRGIGDRQRREAEEPRRMAADRLGLRVVRVSREGLRRLDIELLDARRGQRKRLHRDAGGVHRRDPAVADVEELIDERREPPAKLLGPLLQPPIGAVEKSGRGEMFLKRDYAHCRNPSGGRSELKAPRSASP